MTDIQVALELVKLVLESKNAHSRYDTVEKIVELYRQCLAEVRKASAQG